jgi:HAD superfamily hydrolase (TIGR01549 family)
MLNLNQDIIFLDIGGTLVEIQEHFDDYTKRAIENIFPFFELKNTSKNSFTEEAFAIRNEIRANAHQTLYEYSFNDFLELICQKFEIRIKDLDTEAVELSYIESELSITNIFNDTLNFLKELKSKNKRVFAATNNFSEMHVKELLKKFQITEYFDGLFISGNINVRKPSPDFFHHLVKSLSATTEDTIMIGDNIDLDYFGALDFGMKSILVNRHKSHFEKEILYCNSLQELRIIS